MLLLLASNRTPTKRCGAGDSGEDQSNNTTANSGQEEAKARNEDP